MDQSYWNEYYKKKLADKQPSLFAKYVMKEYFHSGKKVLELGCGNGRDSLYFADNGMKVTSIDEAESAIYLLKQYSNKENVSFIRDNFVETKLFLQKFDYIYSRFTMHAINDEEQSKVIKSVFVCLEEEGLFLIEARSVKDELYGQGKQMGRNAFFFNQHYRRFLVKNELIEELKKAGFEIVYEAEERNFAIHGEENPFIIRVVARKAIIR